MSITPVIKEDILQLLKQLELRKLCDTYFAKDFLWTIKGTSVLSGTYTDKEQFFEIVIHRLNQCLLPGWKMHILDHYADNNNFIVEMRGDVKTKAGKDYNNEYCWIFKFADGKVKHLIAYYDSLLVNNTLRENEK